MTESGIYRYMLNGRPTAIDESWSRQSESGGKAVISSRRSVPGVDIQVQAQTLDGVATDFNIEWHAAGEQSLQAQYSLNEKRLSVSRRLGEEEPQLSELDLPADSPGLLLPLMRVFTGPVIQHLLAAGGEGTVVVPFIADPQDRERLLQAQCGLRRAVIIEENARLQQDGGSYTCTHCEFTGDQYSAGTHFWVGEDQLLLRYQWEQSPEQRWDVWLRRLET